MSNPIVTVTVAAASRRLVDLSYARLMLGLDASADTRLLALIDSASRSVENYCNRKLIRETVSEQWRLRQAMPSLQLTRYPVASIVSVTEDTDPALTSDYYEADEETGQLFRLDGSDNRLSWCARKITVAYSGGYVPEDDTGSDVPEDLRDGTLAIVKSGWFAKQRDPYERSVDIPGLATISYGFGSAMRTDSGFPPEAEALLAPYRRWAIG